MKSMQAQLLASLGGGVRPIDPVDPASPAPDSMLQTFDALLSDAIAGDVKTDLPIRFAPSLSGVYSSEDQGIIARGVDRAAASGVEHALILHEKRTLRVDVRNRIVVEAYPTTSQEVIDGIDGFVSVQTDADTEDADREGSDSKTLSTPARIVRNASLVHALATQQGGQ